MATNGYTNGLSQQATNSDGPGRGFYTENGRRFQAWHRGQYLQPIDEIELDRLDAMHKFLLVARLYRLYSPHIDLSNISDLRVLDLGCGTGMWALDMAKKFFGVGHVHGVDLSTDMQAREIFPNNEFMPMDIEERWAPFLEENSYHLIHSSMLAGSIHFGSWPHIYAEVLRHLVPGGWAEQVEVDWYPCNDDGPVSDRLKFWADELHTAMDRLERPLRVDPLRTQRLLADAGFVDIKQEVIRLPVNGGGIEPFEIDVGRWFNLSLHKSFLGLSTAPLFRAKGWKLEDIERLERQVLDEIAERGNRSYCKLYIWTARRPPHHVPK